jgi:hypothetical protein
MAMAPLARSIIICCRKSAANRLQTNSAGTTRSIYPVFCRHWRHWRQRTATAIENKGKKNIAQRYFSLSIIIPARA